jgi:hypothetical protein
MQIKSPRSRKKLWIFISVVGIIVVAFLVWFFVLNKTPSDDQKVEETTETNKVDYGSATDEQKSTGADAKKEFIERQDAEQNNQGQTAQSSVSISNISQEGALLRVRTTVASTTDGTCKFVMSRQGESSITREAATQDMGTYSTCKGFDIDTTGMKEGPWLVSVGFSKDQANAVATTSVEIK